MGGMMAVTLMSSDMGKLYAALAGDRSAAANCRSRDSVRRNPAVRPIGMYSRTPPERSAAARSKCRGKLSGAAPVGLARHFGRAASSSVRTPTRARREGGGDEEQE